MTGTCSISHVQGQCTNYPYLKTTYTLLPPVMIYEGERYSGRKHGELSGFSASALLYQKIIGNSSFVPADIPGSNRDKAPPLREGYRGKKNLIRIRIHGIKIHRFGIFEKKPSLFLMQYLISGGVYLNTIHHNHCPERRKLRRTHSIYPVRDRTVYLIGTTRQ